MPEQLAPVMRKGEHVGVTLEMAKGAAAGAAGVWVMDRLDWFMVEHGTQEAWKRTQAVRPNRKDPAHNMAGMAAEAVGLEPPPQPHLAGVAVHYAVGIGPAAIYGATRWHLPGGVMSRGLVSSSRSSVRSSPEGG